MHERTDRSAPGQQSARPARPRRGPLARLLDLLGSIWFGVAIMALLFVYMSVGSAGYVIRQTRWFEMTEYEWFHWWPFDLLVALLCLSLITATLRRIPFRVVNLGVWMIHTGIVILCVGSVIYFSAKVEGDTPVFRRRVVIESPHHPPINLIALPGAHAVVGTGPDRRVYEVVSVRPDWPILTGADAGKRAFAVQITVATEGGAGETPPAFTRQLLDGYPQYTEDVVPGRGRAIKALGRALVDDSLAMRLEPEPQEWFYLVNSWALYTREIGPSGEAGPWSQRPVRALPRYNDYIASREEVWPTLDGAGLAVDPIDLAARPADAADPLPPDAVRVTGYLRYAGMQRRLVPGDPARDPVNPAAWVRLRAPGGFDKSYELAAFEPGRDSAEQGELRLRWAETDEDVDRLASITPGSIVIEAGEGRLELPVPRPEPGVEAPWVDIPGAEGHAVRIREVVDNLPIGEAGTVSVAVVDVRTPAGSFTRWAADRAELSRDFHDADAESAHGASGAGGMRAPDPAFRTWYTPGHLPPRLTLVARPGHADLLALIGQHDGSVDRRPAPVGSAVEIDPGVTATVTAFTARGRLESRPVIIPKNQRDKDAGTNYAMVKVELSTGGVTQSRWVPFHQYVFEDSSYAYGGRFRYEPARFRLADGRTVEILFSRERRPLPHPVTLDDFRVIAHVGGFTGEMPSIRDWESVIRFGGAGEPRTVRVNEPVSHAGFRYFQAMWDPPRPGEAGGGLNFTGLGIGNRKGVVTQLAGSILAVLGMLYAFYVKPVIKRRRVAAALERAAARAPDPAPLEDTRELEPAR